MQIPRKVKYILEQLEQNQFEGYAVGGCVRDTILGRTPGDWDITTSARPDEVKKIFARTVDTGIEHGTVTVLLGGEAFEVTTYRVDGEYRDHRHPEKVEFTPNLTEDLKRRDFTINAMAFNPKSGIVDLFGGMEDIRRRCIRCVGNPEERFSEDALRMLRGIRFAGQLGFEIEEKTQSAIRRLAPTIQNVSSERIRMEVNKLLLSEQPEKILLAESAGLCRYFLPELSEMLATAQNNPHHRYDVGNHVLCAVRQVRKLACQCRTEEQRELSPYDRGYSEKKVDTILAFAALLHDVGKPVCKTTDEKGVDHFYGHDVKGGEMAQAVMRRLRFDNDTIHMAARIVRYHERRYDGSRRTLRRLVSQAGTDVMPYLFLIQQADILAQSNYQREQKLAELAEAKKMFVESVKAHEAVCIKDLAVNGKDLISLGIKPGPEVGKMLQELLGLVLEDPAKNNSKFLLTEAQKRISM